MGTSAITYVHNKHQYIGYYKQINKQKKQTKKNKRAPNNSTRDYGRSDVRV